MIVWARPAAVFRTTILHIDGFGLIRILFLTVKSPKHTGNSPGNETRRIWVYEPSVRTKAVAEPRPRQHVVVVPRLVHGPEPRHRVGDAGDLGRENDRRLPQGYRFSLTASRKENRQCWEA